MNQLLERLRRALEAERSFAATSAHELRTPVAAALAQAQRLIIETTDAAVRKRARDIEVALRRLSGLSEKLMQLARAEGGRLHGAEPVDTGTILRMIVDEPVSYTHLDVYKRQLQCRERACVRQRRSFR